MNCSIILMACSLLLGGVQTVKAGKSVSHLGMTHRQKRAGIYVSGEWSVQGTLMCGTLTTGGSE